MDYIELTAKDGAVFMFNTIEEADVDGDYDLLVQRKYNNGVKIEYSKKETSLYVYWISSEDMHKGAGTSAFSDFLREFKNFTIELTAVQYYEWYERLGFKYINNVTEEDEETGEKYFLGIRMRKEN